MTWHNKVVGIRHLPRDAKLERVVSFVSKQLPPSFMYPDANLELLHSCNLLQKSSMLCFSAECTCNFQGSVIKSVGAADCADRELRGSARAVPSVQSHVSKKAPN